MAKPEDDPFTGYTADPENRCCCGVGCPHFVVDGDRECHCAHFGDFLPLGRDWHDVFRYWRASDCMELSGDKLRRIKQQDKEWFGE